MKVTIITGGSHGDLHPFLAIGRTLVARGHDVVLLAHPYFRADVEAAHLSYRPIAESIDVDRIIRNPDLMHPLKGGAVVFEMLARSAPESITALEAHLSERRPDVLLAHHICFGARWLAAEHGVPCALAALAPLVWLSPHDPVPPMQRRPGTALAARLLGAVLMPVLRWYGGRLINRLRREVGFAPEPDAMAQEFRGGDLNLGLWSPVLRGPVADDPPQGVICGFPWYDRSDREQSLAPALEQFLAAGQPPIVFSLGTAAVYTARDFYAIAAQACERLGRRGVLLVGLDENMPRDLPATLIAWRYAPFSLILPRGCASVHHGGIGSTAQALRAGRPMVVVPHAHDQFHNALHAIRLGVADMVPRHRLSVDRLARALDRMLGDPGAARRAEDLASHLAGEDGAAVAADRLENLARCPPARKARTERGTSRAVR